MPSFLKNLGNVAKYTGAGLFGGIPGIGVAKATNDKNFGDVAKYGTGALLGGIPGIALADAATETHPLSKNIFGPSKNSASNYLNSQNQNGDIIPEGTEIGQLRQFTPLQMEIFKRYADLLSPDSYIGRLARGDEEAFQEAEYPAYQEFGKLQSSIGNRFAGVNQGELSSRRSSGFYNSQTGAASDFAKQLQSRRQALQRQAILDMGDISKSLLSERPYDRFLVNKQDEEPSFGRKILAGGLAAGGAGLGGYFGGPQGAVAGGKAGSELGKAFL